MEQTYIEIRDKMRVEAAQLAEQSRARATLLAHDKPDIISIMERSGAKCRWQNGYVYEFDYVDLEVKLVNQAAAARLLVTAHRPVEQSERENFERECTKDPAWRLRFEYVQTICDGSVPGTVVDALEWLGKTEALEKITG